MLSSSPCPFYSRLYGQGYQGGGPSFWIVSGLISSVVTSQDLLLVRRFSPRVKGHYGRPLPASSLMTSANPRHDRVPEGFRCRSNGHRRTSVLMSELRRWLPPLRSTSHGEFRLPELPAILQSHREADHPSVIAVCSDRCLQGTRRRSGCPSPT